MTVPLYSYDHAFQGYIPETVRAEVGSQWRRQTGAPKGGVHRAIRRVVMHRWPGDPKPTTLRDHLGQGYSWEHPLDDGHQPVGAEPRWWEGSTCATRRRVSFGAQSPRPIFIRVVLDCMVGRSGCAPQCGSDNSRHAL